MDGEAIMGTKEVRVHVCDSCGRQVKHGVMDSSYDADGRSLDRLWTVKIVTCIAAVQINDETKAIPIANQIPHQGA